MSFAKAVCLTEKGIEDAKLIGEVFKVLNIPVGHVVSSPSCRARETAIFAFERIDRIEPSLLHRTAMREDQHILMGNKIREVVENIKIEDGKNIILSGHGGTLSNDFKNKVGIIDETEVDDIDERLETGIIVIEQKKINISPGINLIASMTFL
jgi:broad specificity phosphatase PhoE